MEVSQQCEILANNQWNIWVIALVVGSLFSILGIREVFKKEKGETDYGKATFFQMLALWIMYIPEELYNQVTSQKWNLGIIEALTTALLRTLNLYLGNGYEKIVIDGHVTLSSVYAIVRVVINIVSIILIVGFVASFLNAPVQYIQLKLKKRRKTYLFSSCNKKSLMIASTIPKGIHNIVFCNVDDSISAENKAMLAEIQAIYLNKDTKTVVNYMENHASEIEIFLCDENETDNLKLLTEVSEVEYSNHDKPIKIYIELFDTPWSLYDNYYEKLSEIAQKRLTINFLRKEEAFAYNHLLKHSIFENAIPVIGEKKQIRVLLVGMNSRNEELMKAILHLSQMPGYELVMKVIDENSSLECTKRKMPEIFTCGNLFGDSEYKLEYVENVNFDTNELGEQIDNFKEVTYAFINVGDDLRNIALALRVQSMLFAKNSNANLFVNVFNDEIVNKWDSIVAKNLIVVGNLLSEYQYSHFTMSDIEKATIAIHNERYKNKKTWKEYCNIEYNRHSVYARTLSFKYKVEIIQKYHQGNYALTKTERIWKIYEHMRWNVYTRTMGYVKATEEHLVQAKDSKEKFLPKETRDMLKVHNDLVPFEQLSKEEQDKDALILTTEIIKILMELN